MGDNYGLNDNYEYLELSLDSLDASVPYSPLAPKTDWGLFQIGGKGPIEDIVAIKVLNAQIPYSWYNINSLNNTFKLYENNIFSNNVVLQVGQYDRTTLITAISNALTIASTNSILYSTTIVPNLGKYVITSFTGSLNSPLPNATMPFSLVFGNSDDYGNYNPRIQMGFNPGRSNISTIENVIIGVTNLSTFALTAPNTMDIRGLYLYINSVKFGTDIGFYLPTGALNLGGGKNGPQLAKIPITCEIGEVINYTDPDPQKWFQFELLQSLSIFDLFLSLNNTSIYPPLNLNGRSFSIKLGILTSKKKKVDTLNSEPRFKKSK